MAALAPAPKFYQTDENGAPLAGGFVYTYISGTTTPLATYTDAGGGTANTNPVELDSAGRCNMWLLADYEYKFVVTSATGTPVYTVNNISASATLPDVEAYIDSVTTRAVNTMAALRLLSFADWQRGYAFGYYSKGDGGGGSYYYDSSDTTSGCKFTGSISGTTLTVSAVTNGALSVGQMVCRGDTGATVAWITALGSGSGGTGTYTLSASATVSSMTMMADNGGTTIVAADGGRWKLAQSTTPTVAQFGADKTGTSDSYWSFYAALAAVDVMMATDGTYLLDSDLKIAEAKTLKTQSRNTILKRRTAASSTGPVVALVGNFARIEGEGTIQTQKACETGILSVGYNDATSVNVLYAHVGPFKLLGPGGSATNCGLFFYSYQATSGGNYATYFATVEPGMLIDSVGVGVNLTNGCNAHTIFGIDFQGIYTSGYKLAGAYGNTVHGGFCHTKDPASAGVTIINLLNGTTGTDPWGRAWVNGTVKNQFFGAGGEPGGTSYSVDIGANANNNTILLLHNTSNGPTDAGTNNIIIYDGNIANYGRWTNVAYDSANFTNAGGTSWTVDNADQSVYQYMLIGKTLWMNVIVANTTATGAVFGLKIKIPNGYTCAKRTVVPCQYKDGATYATGVVDTDPALSGYIIVMKDVAGSVNWTGGANATNAYVNVCFPIS